MDITHCSGQLFPAQSRTLWGASGIPLYSYHAEGSRHLPVGAMRGRVKALKSTRTEPDSEPEQPSRPPPGMVLPAGALIPCFTFPPAEKVLQTVEGAVWPRGCLFSEQSAFTF